MIDQNSSRYSNSDHSSAVSSCMKFKNNNKIAAYDINFKGIERNSNDIQNDSQKANFNIFSVNQIESSPAESNKKINPPIITDFMYEYNNEDSIERNNNYLEKSNKITFKSKNYILITFLLLVFTLLPLQYHNENFYIQIKKMQDYCNYSKGFFYDNQTYILDTIFPYGFSSSLEFDKINDQLNIINEKKQDIIKIKYMSKEECKQRNLTNLVNIVTIEDGVRTTKPFVVNSQFVSLLKIKQKKILASNTMNAILICENKFFQIKKRSSQNQIPEEYFNFGLNSLSKVSYNSNNIC